MRKCMVFFMMWASVFAQAEVGSFRLSWRSDPSTSMVIGWTPVSGKNHAVCFDTEDHGDNVAAYRQTRAVDKTTDYKGLITQFVRLENLKPDTAYYFVVRDSETVSRRLWFKTAPAEKKPFTFIAGGDSRNNSPGRRKGNKLASKLRPLFILFGGDYTASGTSNQWTKWLSDWQDTISEDGRIYPIIATHGNHENRDMQMISKLFDAPHPDQYYTLGFAGDLLRIWTLNTELFFKDASKVPAQQAWIEQALPKYKDADWKITTYHRPMRPHTAKKREGKLQYDAWATLFDEQGVDMVIESDTHMVKRTYPIRPSNEEGSSEGFIRDDQNGMVFLGEGSWGAPNRPADDNKPWTMASDSFIQFKWIQVFPEEVFIRTVKFEQEDAVTTLKETNLFEEPKGMVFWEPETGKVLRLPFDSKHKSYQKPAKAE